MSLVKHLKDRERVKLANPFSTKRVKELKAQQAARDDMDAHNWTQEVCTFKDAHEGSAVIGSSESEREFSNLAALQFPENRGTIIIIEFLNILKLNFIMFYNVYNVL